MLGDSTAEFSAGAGPVFQQPAGSAFPHHAAFTSAHGALSFPYSGSSLNLPHWLSPWLLSCFLLFLLEKLLRDVPGTADLALQGQDSQPPPLWVPYPAFLVMPTLHSFPQLAPSWLVFLRSLQGSRQFQLRSQRESPKRNGKRKTISLPTQTHIFITRPKLVCYKWPNLDCFTSHLPLKWMGGDGMQRVLFWDWLNPQKWPSAHGPPGTALFSLPPIMPRMLWALRGKAWGGQSPYLDIRRPRPTPESALLWISVSPSTE